MSHDKVIKALKLTTYPTAGGHKIEARMRITFEVENDPEHELRYGEIYAHGRNRADAISKVFATAIEFVDREVAP